MALPASTPGHPELPCSFLCLSQLFPVSNFAHTLPLLSTLPMMAMALTNLYSLTLLQVPACACLIAKVGWIECFSQSGMLETRAVL